MVHDINSIKAEFEEWINILAPINFKGVLDNAGDYDYFREFRSKVWDTDMSKFDCAFHSGCSRVVLVPNCGDYVFKFQYDDGDTIDYCKQECVVYGMAKERGVEEYFAWTECLGQYGRALVYVMEKVEVNESRNSDESYRYHAEKWKDEHPDEDFDECDIDYDDTDGMIEFAIAHNGGYMESAIDLICELGINDLHSGNWGFRGDVLVLTDYGGYGHKIGVEID